MWSCPSEGSTAGQCILLDAESFSLLLRMCCVLAVQNKIIALVVDVIASASATAAAAAAAACQGYG